MSKKYKRKKEQAYQPDLGPCCACECRGAGVRNLLMLNKKSPLPGKGWGCFQCDLPLDGATTILCDDCFESKAEPKWACRGWPAKDGRIPIGELTGEHEHDFSKHPEHQERIH